MDFYGFYTGRSFDAYHYLGAHLTQDGAVSAPFPRRSEDSLIGEFSNWEELPMARYTTETFGSGSSPRPSRG